MSKNGIMCSLFFVNILFFIFIIIIASPVIKIKEENCPDPMELLQNELNLLKGKSNFHFNNMSKIIEEEFYHNKTCLYQFTGAIKSDNSMDLPSFLGFDPADIAIWPANSPVLEFIINFGSCFPIKSHRTSTESVKKLMACINANSELYQCPKGFERMAFN
ncbi:GSCOCG00008382001-RA-CDS [Cotesia congregata]|uniref:Uncharacterized protein n=1 Tax=Cotesia congregata TaxID=51543 RepID=A0A8J2H5G9_COTCN|nr:GSCOCG00008382001-RA-CDS [Cotesia congregata]CAG5073982.1 Protein of unknown function [Cotesia congregata]